MTEDVTIRELHALNEILAAFPVFAQGNSHIGEALFRERLQLCLPKVTIVASAPT